SGTCGSSTRIIRSRAPTTRWSPTPRVTGTEATRSGVFRRFSAFSAPSARRRGDRGPAANTFTEPSKTGTTLCRFVWGERPRRYEIVRRTRVAPLVLVALAAMLALPAASVRAADRMQIGFFDDLSFRYAPDRDANLAAAAAAGGSIIHTTAYWPLLAPTKP